MKLSTTCTIMYSTYTYMYKYRLKPGLYNTAHCCVIEPHNK